MQRPMYVHRDHYARGAYRRTIMSQGKETVERRYGCGWCGHKPARLYNYQWEGDDQTRSAKLVNPWFCNFSCFTDYHN